MSLLQNIKRGVQQRPQRVIIYGPEGVGKSTLAAGLPAPVLLDTEQGSSHIDVARLDCRSYGDVINAIEELTQGGHEFRTVIIDSIDWEEDKKGFMEANKLTMNDVRTLIPTAHGHVADHLAANKQDTTILMTGGDTLMGYMKLIGCTQITPVCEIEQGVVVSNLKNHGFVQQIISKSGGFGTKDVLVKIADKILNQK